MRILEHDNSCIRAGTCKLFICEVGYFVSALPVSKFPSE